MKYLYGDFIRCPRCGKNTLFIHPFKVEKYNERETSRRICQRYCRYYGTKAEKITPEICNKCIKLEVVEGELVCNNCGNTYKIDGGVPKLLVTPESKMAPQVVVFDKHTQEYDNWFNKNPGETLFKIELKAIKKLIGRTKQYRSLEVGVGTGQFAQALGVTFGVDLSINALKKAQQRGIFSVYGAAENLPFQDDSFSLVLMIVTLCYVKDPLMAIKEVHRVLEAGGEFITCFIEKNSPWGKLYLKKKSKGNKFYKPANFYSAEEVKEWLESANFTIEDTIWTLSQPPEQEKYKIEAPKNKFAENAGFVCIKARKK